MEISIEGGPREPSVQWNHIDGPVLSRGDGTLYWLSWADRWMLWRGKTTLRALATKESLRGGSWWRRLLCDLGHHKGHNTSGRYGMWFQCAFCRHKSGFIRWSAGPRPCDSGSQPEAENRSEAEG